MKRLLITFLVLIASVISVFAQNISEKELKFRSDFPWKYEVRVGYGGSPSLDISNYLSYCGPGCRVDPRMPEYTVDDLYRPRTTSEYVTGVFSAEFSIHYKRWFSLAFNLAANGIWSNVEDPVSGKIVEKGASFQLTPIARFYYLNKPVVRLYSGVGFGLYTGYYDGDYEFYPSFKLTPIGITLGRKVFFFAETSVGTASMGGNFGVGYRF